MSRDPTPKLHRRCEKCDHIVHTSAKKAFKRPRCGHTTRITRSKPVKKPNTRELRKTGIDTFIKPEA